MTEETFQLYDLSINGQDAWDYVTEAANEFARTALDDIVWDRDSSEFAELGENPLGLCAGSYVPVHYTELDEAWTDPADSPVSQVEQALWSQRAVDIVNLLKIPARAFGNSLYYDQNGSGAGFWDMDFAKPEYEELSASIGFKPWRVVYSYDPALDPGGNYLTMRVESG